MVLSLSSKRGTADNVQSQNRLAETRDWSPSIGLADKYEVGRGQTSGRAGVARMMATPLGTLICVSQPRLPIPFPKTSSSETPPVDMVHLSDRGGFHDPESRMQERTDKRSNPCPGWAWEMSCSCSRGGSRRPTCPAARPANSRSIHPPIRTIKSRASRNPHPTYVSG